MHAESDTGTADVNEAIVAFKEKMADRNGTLKRAFGEIRDHVRREVDELQWLALDDAVAKLTHGRDKDVIAAVSGG